MSWLHSLPTREILLTVFSRRSRGLDSHRLVRLGLRMDTQEDWLNALRQGRTVSAKSWNTALVLSVLFGLWGADRFYAGRPVLGLLKVMTAGGLCVWWVVDIILLLQGQMKDNYGRVIRRPARP